MSVRKGRVARGVRGRVVWEGSVHLGGDRSERIGFGTIGALSTKDGEFRFSKVKGEGPWGATNASGEV